MQTLDHLPAADRLGLDEATIGRVLAEALSRGADFADLYVEQGHSNAVELEDGLVHSATSVVEQGAGIRAVVGEQTGYAYAETLELDALRRAARQAAAIAARPQAGGDPGPFRMQDVPRYYGGEGGWGQVGIQEKLPLVSFTDKTVRALEPAVKHVRVAWMDSDRQVLVATSDGIVHRDHRPMAGLRLTVTAEKDGQTQAFGGSLYRRAPLAWFSEARLRELCQKTVDDLMRLFDARPAPAGELPVVLAAGASGILLHEAIGHGLEADFNRKGVSIYADMVGRQVAPDFVTVVDDGTIEQERGALNVDDEGAPTERTTLIENGVLKGFLHDRISAAQYGVAPTGSGRRQSFRHVPMPRMRCTYMESGPHGTDEMIASVDRGIVCETFTNGQVQIGAGDFTFFVKNGWMIEKGKITHPIKNVNIIGNGPEALRDIAMVADDLTLDTGGWTCGKDGQGVPVSQGMPSVLVKRLVVGGEEAA